MKARKMTALAAAVLFAPLTCYPASGTKMSGSIAGVVSNTYGVPQMGAVVNLLNRYDRVIERIMTDERGSFAFDSLPPDTYSVRVSLVSFVPALKKGIAVQPGIRSMLAINLANLFSSIELIYNGAGQTPLMSDDWKWTLRSAIATRPVLRFSDPAAAPTHTASAVFSNTRGVLKLSAGDSVLPTLGGQPDLGTAFAVATSFLGHNELVFSGNVGYASQSGIPAAGFRTSFTHSSSSLAPEVTLTMRQVFLPGRVGGFAQPENLPALRTLSAKLSDHAQLTDELSLDYGIALESVSFLERLNYVSPYARFHYDAHEFGEIEFGYSSGLPPVDLIASNASGPEAERSPELATLALFPRVSLRDGRAHVQRIDNFEIGYRRVVGSRAYSLGAYHEAVSNAAVNATSTDGAMLTHDVLPDLFSGGSVVNLGKYSSIGYMASVTQSLGDHWAATLAYGNGGVLRADRSTLSSGDPDELRSILRSHRRSWVTARLTGVTPVTGTKFTASYQFTDNRSLTPGHFYLTQRVNPEPGLNVYVRQPIPAWGGLPGRLEASAELRNLLAQGYLPINTPDGHQLVLVHSPRSLRGGLAFIF